MRVILVLLFLCTNNISNSNEYSQIPLKQFADRNKEILEFKPKTDDERITKMRISYEYFYYVCLRCAGYNGWMTAMLGKEDSEIAKNAEEKHSLMMAEFSLLATELHSIINQKDFNTSNVKVLELILKINQNYIKDSKIIFSQTGKYTSGYIDSDEDVCTGFYMIKNRIYDIIKLFKK